MSHLPTVRAFALRALRLGCLGLAVCSFAGGRGGDYAFCFLAGESSVLVLFEAVKLFEESGGVLVNHLGRDGCG